MNYELPKKQSENAELLGADDEKLHRLLGTLKKVEAPKDFDFKLKARIAQGQPQNPRPAFLTPVLRYVLPLSVVVMLAAFVAFNMSYNAETQSVATAEPAKNEAPIVAPNPLPVASNIEVAQSPTIASTSVDSATEVDLKNVKIEANTAKFASLPKVKNADAASRLTVATVQPKRKIFNAVDTSGNGGGSRDSALGVSKQVLPKGLETTPNSEKVENFEQNKISLREVLSPIGLEGEFVGKNWKITSVQENSAAMRSGLKVGDVIEAIDGKELSAETKSSQTFTGKTFRVVRDGKPVEIELNTK